MRFREIRACDMAKRMSLFYNKNIHRVVYLSAGAFFCINCLPHAVPAVARRRRGAAAKITGSGRGNVGRFRLVYRCFSWSPCSREQPGLAAPAELTTHVQRIAAAMVREAGHLCWEPHPPPRAPLLLITGVVSS